METAQKLHRLKNHKTKEQDAFSTWECSLRLYHWSAGCDRRVLDEAGSRTVNVQHNFFLLYSMIFLCNCDLSAGLFGGILPEEC